tara:strand:+ start:3253 stop:3576 length:324 start_codon:yes stop_codon:yes gene_type:complete
MEYSTHINLIQQQNERDVLGSMLFSGNMTIALLNDLTPYDFMYRGHRAVYKAMNNIQNYGKFDTKDLLDNDNIKRGKDILNLMFDCVDSNISTKCKWIHSRSIRRNT